VTVELDRNVGLGRALQVGLKERSCPIVARMGSADIADSDRRLVLSLYHWVSLFFLTSQIEYFPLVLLEAQALGLPFLYFPVGNVRELGRGHCHSPTRRDAPIHQRSVKAASRVERLGARGKMQSLAEHLESQIQEQYVRMIRGIVDTH
jgi:hypothetical protein